MSAVQDRRGFIGGSDAARIIAGDWLALYEEKVGIRQPEDLSGVFRVQLGTWTEPFHRNWLVAKCGIDIRECLTQASHPVHSWMRGQFDGWLPDENTFIDLKHTNERASVRSMTETYLPQIAHYCAVSGREYGYLSFIAGNQDPVVAKIEPGSGYINELVLLEQAFWWHVENQSAPDAPASAAAAKAEAKKVKVNGQRYVDMTGNNAWAAHAGDLINYQDAARAFDAAKERLKELVEDDVAEASGHGVTIKRDKRGSLRFTIAEYEAAA